MSIGTLIIEGRNIHGIASFYDEINRVFMADEDWKLGPSLDAFDDLLYGGYGALKGDAPVILIWREMERSQEHLGRDATRTHYLTKLDHPERFNIEHIRRDLDILEREGGPTYFDIVQEIIAGHRNIDLRPT
ncbi:barstar family protein [Brevundimonas diminuta]|uniref:barstar family protein n=1 Tax=Brevundimonas diminuta TaxID=293 RepID=UPI0030F99B50